MWYHNESVTFINFHLTKSINPDHLYEIYQKQDFLLCELFDAGKISLDDLRKQRLVETLRVFNLEVTEEDHNYFQEQYMVTAYRNIKPNRNYNELLERLSQNYKLAIMTNGSSEFQREKIKRMEFDRFIHHDYIFISEEIGYSKPSPEIYQHALNLINLRAEDVFDVIGPMKLGMKAVWINRDGRSLQPNIKVSIPVIMDVIELEGILKIGVTPIVRDKRNDDLRL